MNKSRECKYFHFCGSFNDTILFDAFNSCLRIASVYTTLSTVFYRIICKKTHTTLLPFVLPIRSLPNISHLFRPQGRKQNASGIVRPDTIPITRPINFIPRRISCSFIKRRRFRKAYASPAWNNIEKATDSSWKIQPTSRYATEP